MPKGHNIELMFRYQFGLEAEARKSEFTHQLTLLSCYEFQRFTSSFMLL